MDADAHHADRGCQVLKKCLSQGNLSQQTELTATSSSSASQEEVHYPQHVKNSLEAAADCVEDVPIILSYSQDTTDESYVLPNGIPREITVFHDKSWDEVEDDDYNLMEKLEELKQLATSYNARVSSNDGLLQSLRTELARTKGQAHELLEERKTLLQSVQDLEEENTSRNEQSSLLRMLMCFALFLYLCGGSEQFLIISVGVYLCVEVIASIV